MDYGCAMAGEVITLSFRQLIELSTGLKQLDAIKESDKDVVPLAFDFTTSYRLMRNSIVVERERAIFEKMDREAAKAAGFFDGMAAKNADGSANEENAKKADDYQHRRANLLDGEVKLDGIMPVTVEQLLTRPEEFKKSKRNPVPQSVIHRLAPILEEAG